MTREKNVVDGRRVVGDGEKAAVLQPLFETMVMELMLLL